MVKVTLGGICCTSTMMVSEKALLRSPRTIVTSPVAFGNACLMPLGTSGNCTMVVWPSELSICTLRASFPSRCNWRKKASFALVSPECESDCVPARGTVAAFVAADAMPACILRMNRRAASGIAHFETMRRTNCMCLLLYFQKLSLSLLLKHRLGLSVGHGLRASVQRRVAAIEQGTRESRVVQCFLRVLQRGEPHAQMFQLDARCRAALVLRVDGRCAVVGGEGDQCNGLERGLT